MIRRRIIWLLLTLISIITISFYGGVISYSFFYACILLPVVSGVYLIYVYMRFSIYQQINVTGTMDGENSAFGIKQSLAIARSSRNIICRQAVPYSFILQNDDITVYTGISVRLYSSFSHVEDMEDNKRYRLFPGARIQIDSRLTCKYRGEYDVGVKEIIVYDFFGLFRVTYKLPSVIRALVTPRIVAIHELRCLPELAAMLEVETVYDKTEQDVVVRDYVVGDSIRRIHWKSTARHQCLKVRNEIGNERRSIAVFFDVERISDEIANYLPSENKVLETVIALLNYFVHQNMEAKLIWRMTRVEKRNVVDISSFEHTFRELSSISFDKDYQTINAIQEAWQSRLFISSKIVFLVLQRLSPEILRLAQELIKEEKIVVLYVITMEDISEYIKESSMRIYIMAIGPEQELSEVL